ncbi:DUF1963 domain-containing protein [Sphingopyxis kveilinensis]|uniref:DUF1963 domain-containing protein n=1 Tax=Sphingopyxis kveilinensis TaxID=3114367 RepID=UPI0030D5C68C
MNEVELAALMLAAMFLLGVVVAVAIWRARRSAISSPSVPRAARTPRESRMPKLPRKAPAIADVEIAPSRLARVSGKAPLEPPRDLMPDDSFEPDLPVDVMPEPAAIEAALETMATEVETAAAKDIDEQAAALTLHLVPQIPPRDAISTHSWLGGRPRLATGAAWPQIDDLPADFLAQIGCADLPRDLWGGLGPRHGALAFFIHRHRPEVRVLHVGEPGAPLAPPYALNLGEGWFGPYGDLADGDLASFAVRAFPQWPVDLVDANAADASSGLRDAGDADDLDALGYDIADPAFHPFDWGSLTAMAAILESRLGQLVTDPPADDDPASAALIERCAAINQEARERADEIIGIIHESAVRGAFSAGDATAVMAALHAIRWAALIPRTNPDGAQTFELSTLSLTEHRADADLWVRDYRTMLFDRAKHAWCADPANLSAPARAYFEPFWQGLAAREMASVGGERDGELILLALPSSGLMSRRFGDGQTLLVTMARADLAIGDFAKARAQLVR